MLIDDHLQTIAHCSVVSPTSGSPYYNELLLGYNDLVLLSGELKLKLWVDLIFWDWSKTFELFDWEGIDERGWIFAVGYHTPY